MSKNQKNRREWQRKRRKHRWDKEPRLSVKDGNGITQLTPYNAVCLMRHEAEKTKTNSTSLVRLK